MTKEHKATLAILAAFFVAIAGITLLSGCHVEQGEPPLSNDDMPGDSSVVVIYSGSNRLVGFRDVKGKDLWVGSTENGTRVKLVTRSKDGIRKHEFQGHNISVVRIQEGK